MDGWMGGWMMDGCTCRKVNSRSAALPRPAASLEEEEEEEGNVCILATGGSEVIRYKT